MESIIKVNQLQKTYADGLEALKKVNLEIRRGEIFALLGPNGAGKSTLINIICGIVKPSSGQILVGEFDVVENYRQARSLIGLVPQELTTDAFENVWNTVSYSRGLFGKKKDNAFIEKTLRNLGLWDKRKNQLRTLSGGMKRRVMMAKALSHEPAILFLDEPTAGVDVELRKSMWEQVRALRQSGVTIILTTHYLEEAEEMADRIGVIDQGKIIVTDEKKYLMKKLGTKILSVELKNPISSIPKELQRSNLELSSDGSILTLKYDINSDHNGVTQLLFQLHELGIVYKDLSTKQSSLEEIFVQLVSKS